LTWTQETREHFLGMFRNTHRCNFHCGEGWKNIVNNLCEELLMVAPEVEVAQIKEKFGTLRFYIGGVHEDIYKQVHALIGEAERKSAVTCEQCGEPGGMTSIGGWMQTLCPTCHQKKIARTKADYDAYLARQKQNG